MNNRFMLGLIFAFIFSFTLVIAAGPSFGVPHQFYGNAVYNGAGANGLTIEVYIDGAKVGNTTTLNGKYGYSPIFLIKDPDSEYSGKIITFYLNGVNTGSSFIFENGASTKLDLSATGTTPSPPSPPSGGGNTGGSSGGNGGSSGSSKTTTTGAATTQTTTTKTTPTGTGEQETQPEINIISEKQGFFSGITGAVTGAIGTPATIGVLIFIIALVAIYIYAVIMRKRGK